MSHFCPIWRSKMTSKSLHCYTNSSLDFLALRSNEKVRIPTGVLTVEQRLWWMVQSIVPNFICPASWMEAFLSSGRSARHGGHHCRDATLNGTQRSSWYWRDRHRQARLLEGSLKMRRCRSFQSRGHADDRASFQRWEGSIHSALWLVFWHFFRKRQHIWESNYFTFHDVLICVY